jgi:putative glutamine amidotransferase
MTAMIGVTATEIVNTTNPWSPVMYGQSGKYSDAVIMAGGAPFILPLTDNMQILRKMYDNLDGLLLSGGIDINPTLYGQQLYETTKHISDYQDEYEIQLILWALEDKKPILAICRGMQLLNVVCGGSLYQNIPTDLPGSEDHNKSNELAQILGVTDINTNAHHHQAINVIAPDLEPVAWAGDGVIEGIENREASSYIIGIQSHPESLVEQAEKTWLKLFSSFVKAAEKW